MPETFPRSSFATAQFANSGLVVGGTARPHSWQVERSGGAAIDEHATRFGAADTSGRYVVQKRPAPREGPGRR